MALLKPAQSRLFLTPLTGFLMLFLGFPALVNLVYSVSSVSFETLRNPQITGFGNYALVLADGEFWRSVSFSGRFALVTALAECLIGLFLALFLAPLLRAHSVLMAPLMLPLMVAPAMIGLMYRLVLHEFAGPVPYYLFLWLGDSPAFLSVENAFTALAVVEILQWTPFAFLLFYMAYSGISPDIREAAALDGAPWYRVLLWIDLPLMRPTLAIAFFIRFIDGFRVFDNVYALTGSGAGGSTTSLSIYIYQAFFKQGAIGKAVAASVLLFLASLAVLTLINLMAGTRRRA
ncbi:ABC transporter permease [Rhizobium rhizosphaerae]|uniref:ABC transporter permease n=1 Tax=Xaviernesmea rhizosphaerae TaxID=1672749 RepID=A0A1Q9AQB3_9HYPH|nr:sugar ABC transporter permease [Xaviernesmea rhizosphaerae]OLP57613.1 ABC transporter permease [Xaviernesmea rhizosphaerae]